MKIHARLVDSSTARMRANFDGRNVVQTPFSSVVTCIHVSSDGARGTTNCRTTAAACGQRTDQRKEMSRMVELVHRLNERLYASVFSGPGGPPKKKSGTAGPKAYRGRLAVCGPRPHCPACRSTGCGPHEPHDPPAARLTMTCAR